MAVLNMLHTLQPMLEQRIIGARLPIVAYMNRVSF
jgi:hypothetical protein